MKRLLAFVAVPFLGWGASWTPLVNRAPASVGTMLLMTDGTVIALNQSDLTHWLSLTPDVHGSYINGTWTTLAPMSKQRLYFASNVLQSGKLWVFGGEYTGVGIPLNEDGTGEIYDPVANTWTPVAVFPNQSGCAVSQFGGTLTNGSPIVSNIASTAGWQPGWTVAGAGVPSGATIVSVDSATQIHLSTSATQSAGVAMTLTFKSTGNTVQGTNVVSGLPTTAGIQVGFVVNGTGLPTNSAVTSVDSDTQIHIGSNATATGTGTALTFSYRILPPTCYGDEPSILLPGGKILAGSSRNSNTYAYSIGTDSWTVAAVKQYDTSSEQGWAMLEDGSVLTYDIGKSISAGTGYAERYDPVANKWSGITPANGTAGGKLPVLSSGAVGDELGPLLRLQDGRIFVIGANGHTALYTPSTNTWAAGPDTVGTHGGAPFLFAADDAPAALLPNGHVILAADAGLGLSLTGATTAGSPIVTGLASTAQIEAGWAVAGAGIPSGATVTSLDSPTQVTLSANATATGASVAIQFGAVFARPTVLFDFDPAAGTIGPVSPAIPDTRLSSLPAYDTRMLMLPTGQLLLADVSNQLWVYTPDGAANAGVTPAVTGVASNGAGGFTLTGMRLTGQSAGASFGDDNEMDENYPIVSFSNAAGNVYYGRTSNWSYVGVGGGSAAQTVDFTLQPKMPAGLYSMTVSAAGLPSTPLGVTLGADLKTLTPGAAISAVQDAESARQTVAPGQWTAIYGAGLANSTRIWNNADFTGGTAAGSPLPTSLDGVTATVGGQPAAVYFISPNQIDIQIPANVPAGAADVVVNNNGVLTPAATVTVGQASPSFYYYPSGNVLFPAAVHLSGKLIGDPSAGGSGVEKAHPGEMVVLFANGLAASAAGQVVAPTVLTQPVGVSAGSFPLTVLGTALVYAGEFQINVQLPGNIPTGNYPLTITVPGGSTAGNGVTILLPVGP